MNTQPWLARLVRVMTVICVCGAGSSAAATPEDPALEHARQLLRTSILVDGHNDLARTVRTYAPAPSDVDAYDLRKPMPGQTDLQRLKQGGVGAQFWSVYIPGEMASGFARAQLEQIDLARRIIARYPQALRLALTAADIRTAHRDGRIASLLGMEGGHAIENSPGALRAYFDLGVRYMTLTHNTHTDWADSAGEVPARHGGLTLFGEAMVREMNRLGMLVDLSHTSPDTMDDALRVSRAPVIFSHSSARALCDVPRNVPDEILRRIPANGGIVMVTFVAPFIDPEVARVVIPAMTEFNLRSRTTTTDAEREQLRAEIYARFKMPATTAAKVADHIEYIRSVAGIEHVGIGSDFDGSAFFPGDLSDVSMFPNLFAELIRRGWTDRELRLLAGENLLRVLSRAEAVAAELQKTTPPSNAQIPASDIRSAR